MIGFRFSEFVPTPTFQSPFERLLELFLELLVYTSGEVDEALNWMRELDKEHGLTDDNYTIDDFEEDLKKKGYLEGLPGSGGRMTGKTERIIRQRSLEQIFGKLKKAGKGDHKTPYSGLGDEPSADRRKFQFGDRADRIDLTESLRNAQVNHGINNFSLTEDDLEIVEQEYKALTSTVLMIDISHSMILYGEDRITPAKKVAMALAELITTRYPKDTLDIVVFGDDAWQVSIKDLPYLRVGPFHTNTVAGLELSLDLLRRRKKANKQIFMITDGKPSCIKENGEYYMNSFGLDPKIVNRTLNLASRCRKLRIPVTTFMIARDPYLQKFVEDFTEANHGRAFYTSLKGLGNYIFEDYESNRRRNVN
ncbi:MAG: VWA domain-containing protein [Salibacteraceae bacterium]